MTPERYLNWYLEQNYPEDLLSDIIERPFEELATYHARLDCSFFCKFYLDHYFKKEYSIMHRDLFRIIHRIRDSPIGLKFAEASPRGSAKSTLTVTGQCLWHIANETKHYMMLVKDTADQSKMDLEAIKVELEDNSLLQDHYGDLQGDIWQTAEITTSNGCRMQALGAGMKLRGRKHREYRPDLCIFDDIENEENTNTPEQRKKLERWFTGSALNVGDPGTSYSLIGTILHTDSLLANVLDNPAWITNKYKAILQWAHNQGLWDDWTDIYLDLKHEDRHQRAHEFYLKNEAKMLEGAEVQWPEGQSYYYLQTKLVDVGRSAFDQEYQNEPISIEDRLFRDFHFYHIDERMSPTQDLEFWLTPDGRGRAARVSDCRLYISCDPSLGKTRESDFSAIIVGAKSPTNQLFLLEADVQRRHPNRIIDDIFKHALHWQAYGAAVEILAVESNQFQKFFKDQIAERSQIEGLYLNIEEIKSTQHKDLRIQSLEPDVNNGYILFKGDQKLLIQQLRDYPKASHDDGPDALEMLIKTSRARGGWAFGSA